MAFCNKCGKQLADGAKFCPGCGNPMGAAQSPSSGQQNRTGDDFAAKMSSLSNTADTTAEFDPADINNNKAMAILAYFGLLLLIPLFAAPGSKFARYHCNQGLILLIVSVAWGIAYGVLAAIILAISWRLYFIVSLIGIVSLVFLGLLIIGVVNAAGGRAKELPVIGKFRILK